MLILQQNVHDLDPEPARRRNQTGIVDSFLQMHSRIHTSQGQDSSSNAKTESENLVVDNSFELQLHRQSVISHGHTHNSIRQLGSKQSCLRGLASKRKVDCISISCRSCQRRQSTQPKFVHHLERTP